MKGRVRRFSMPFIVALAAVACTDAPQAPDAPQWNAEKQKAWEGKVDSALVRCRQDSNCGGLAEWRPSWPANCASGTFC